VKALRQIKNRDNWHARPRTANRVAKACPLVAALLDVADFANHAVPSAHALVRGSSSSTVDRDNIHSVARNMLRRQQHLQPQLRPPRPPHDVRLHHDKSRRDKRHRDRPQRDERRHDRHQRDQL
jgi:hypothetical protein